MSEPELVSEGHKEAAASVNEKGMSWLRGKHASWVLAGVSFVESMFAPILIDPFLVAMILAKRALWKWYVLVSVTFSVLGGIAGYLLGAVFFDTIGVRIVELFNMTDTFGDIAVSLDENGFVFVLIGAFTPIPYKVVALASGFVYLDLLTFIIASIFGRFLRLGLVGFAAYAAGPRALPIMQRNLHLFAVLVGVLLIAYIIYKLW